MPACHGQATEVQCPCQWPSLVCVYHSPIGEGMCLDQAEGDRKLRVMNITETNQTVLETENVPKQPGDGPIGRGYVQIDWTS